MSEIKRRKESKEKVSIIRRRPPTIDTGSHWDNIVGGEDICFVCDKKFKKPHEQQYVGIHKHTGEKLLRHHSCESGSANWIAKFGDRLFNKTKKVIEKVKVVLETPHKKKILWRRP